MRRFITLTLGACLFLVMAVVAMPQDKKMDAATHEHMMQMLNDPAMMSMIMDHIAKDKDLHMQMMQKMMEVCKSDKSMMDGKCKMMDGKEGDAGMGKMGMMKKCCMKDGGKMGEKAGMMKDKTRKALEK